MGEAASNSLGKPPVEGWCLTEVKVTKFNFTWTIKNFSFFQTTTNDCLRSSTFSTGDDGDSKWCLILYPRGKRSGDSDYVSLFLRLVSSTKSVISTNVTLFLLNCKNDKCNASTFDYTYKSASEDYGFLKFMQRVANDGRMNELLTKENLRISCQLNIVDSECPIIKSSLPIFEIPPSYLSEHLENLFESQEHSDIVLCCKQKVFHCHKAILASRSPVFSAMFKHDMQENEVNRVFITDTDEITLKELLRFIYTGKAPGVDKMTPDLLISADKYEVNRLKIMCEEALSSTLSLETALNLLHLADKHSADKLKCATIQFIVTNAIAVMGTKEWEDTAREYPDLIIDVSRCLDVTKSPASNNNS